eukprot:1155962-Pelagomonas_calceolata.AAC.10
MHVEGLVSRPRDSRDGCRLHSAAFAFSKNVTPHLQELFMVFKDAPPLLKFGMAHDERLDAGFHGSQAG